MVYISLHLHVTSLLTLCLTIQSLPPQQPKGTGCQHGNPFPNIRVAYGGAIVDTIWNWWNYMIHHVCQQWILPIYLASFGAYLEWFFASIVGIIWCLDICNHLGHDSFNPKQIVFSIDFPPAKHLHGVRNHVCTRHPGVLGLVTKSGAWTNDEQLGGFSILDAKSAKGCFFYKKEVVVKIRHVYRINTCGCLAGISTLIHVSHVVNYRVLSQVLRLHSKRGLKVLAEKR